MAENSPWLTVKQAAARAQVGPKLIYRECAAGGRLRHARVGGRRDLRFLAEWVDAWLVATATPVECRRVA
jgi:excisionase family DNA binding protein